MRTVDFIYRMYIVYVIANKLALAGCPCYADNVVCVGLYFLKPKV